MIQGLALLIAILGLTILIVKRKRFRRMSSINKRALSVAGTVVSSNVARNMLGGPLFGTAYESLIHYLPPNAKEPYEIYRREHNLIMAKEYSVGDQIEVVYDAEAPYKAYPKPEWERVMADIKKAGICFGISVVLLLFDQFLKQSG